MNYENISESNIQLIIEMSGGEWERDMVVYALCLAYNDIDKAVEFIYFVSSSETVCPFIVTLMCSFKTDNCLIKIGDAGGE